VAHNTINTQEIQY